MNVTNRDLFELVKAIGESKSKQEEDRIIAEEVFFRDEHFVFIIYRWLIQAFLLYRWCF